MLSKEFEKIAADEIQTYLFREGEGNISSLQLRDREKFGLPFKLLAAQLSGRKKAAKRMINFISHLKVIKKIIHFAMNLPDCSVRLSLIDSSW